MSWLRQARHPEGELPPQTRIGGPALLGSGATVAQLILDQKVEGSNPSSPATSLYKFG